MRWLINLLKRIMGSETTNKLFKSTASQQFKVLKRSDNNLPNVISDSFTRLIHNSTYVNGNTAGIDFTDYVPTNEFSNPVLYDAYVKRIITGKQIINKAHEKNIYSYTNGSVISIYLYAKNFVDTTEGTTAGELFYILYSMEIANV